MIKSSKHSPGTVLCDDDLLSYPRSDSLSLFCYARGRIVQGNDCSPTSRRRFIGCDSPVVDRRGVCLRVRSPLDEGDLTFSPAGPVLFVTPSSLAWSPVPDASHYEVELMGYGVDWNAQVSQSSLSLPFQLPPDVKVRLSVVAFQGTNVLAVGQTTYSVLSQDSRRELENLILSLQLLPLSSDELALELDLVFSSRGILDEAIRVLKRCIAQDCRSQLVSLQLAQRYRQVGLLDQANLLTTSSPPK